MSEDLSSPELDKLRFLYRVQLQQVAQTERWMEAELTKLRERASRGPRKEPPAYVVSYLRAGGQPVADSLHLGDCRLTSHHVKPLSREQALQILAGDQVKACEICRPDTDLGILD